MNEPEMLAAFAKAGAKRSEMSGALEAKTRQTRGIGLAAAATALLILAGGLLIVQRRAADPLRRLVLGHFARGTRQDVRDAIDAARKAQPGWAATPWRERVATPHPARSIPQALPCC